MDGLRGVAVLLVVEYHVVLGRVHTLSTGLDLFFILSGFLITTLLAEEHDRHGRVSLPDFFRRRGLRLLPALFAYIAANLLMALAGHAGVPTLEGVWDLRTVTVESAAAVFYIYPALLAVWPNTAALRMPHLHSLGQEEWFYAFWAPTFARMMRRDRVRRGITIVIVVLAVIALARLLGVIDANPALVGPLRPDMMFLGAVIALGRRRYLTLATPQLDRLRRRVGIASALGTAGFAVSIAAGGLEGRRVAIAVVTATKLFAVFPIMLVLVAAPSHPLRRALRASWLQWFGRVSYGLYLWHSTVLFGSTAGLSAPRHGGDHPTSTDVAAPPRRFRRWDGTRVALVSPDRSPLHRDGTPEPGRHPNVEALGASDPTAVDGAPRRWGRRSRRVHAGGPSSDRDSAQHDAPPLVVRR
ncbi:MAG: acyltransferase [Actinobacteria bacterium]|nr:acyltransferase [Actinomycetota bacterium]